MSTALTKTERKVMVLKAEGFYSSEIAIKLGSRKRTVETHLYNIYKKIGVRNLAELVKFVNENDMKN